LLDSLFPETSRMMPCSSRVEKDFPTAFNQYV